MTVEVVTGPRDRPPDSGGTGRHARASRRVVGVDVARGMAVIGMVAAHVAVTSYVEPHAYTAVPFNVSDPRTWTDAVHGRPSTLFAVLAGLSVSLMSGGPIARNGVQLVQARLRLAVRAVLLFLLGGILELFNPPLGVILPTYGVLFVLAIGFLTWNPRGLFAMAAGLVVVVPPLVMVVSQLVLHQTQLRQASSLEGVAPRLFFTGAYPVVVFFAYLLVGMGIGRLRLSRTQTQARLVAFGLAGTVVFYGLGTVVHRLAGYDEAMTGGPLTPRDRAINFDGVPASDLPMVIFDFRSLLTISPHTGTWFDMAGTGSVAVMIIGLCLLAPRGLQTVLYPIAAVGSMALSAYTAQVIAIALVGRWDATNAFFFELTAAIVLSCTVWRMTLGRGPLERAISAVTSKAAHLDGPAPGPLLPSTTIWPARGFSGK